MSYSCDSTKIILDFKIKLTKLKTVVRFLFYLVHGRELRGGRSAARHRGVAWLVAGFQFIYQSTASAQTLFLSNAMIATCFFTIDRLWNCLLRLRFSGPNQLFPTFIAAAMRGFNMTFPVGDMTVFLCFVFCCTSFMSLLWQLFFLVLRGDYVFGWHVRWSVIHEGQPRPSFKLMILT